jgi:hypothetical protein
MAGGASVRIIWNEAEFRRITEVQTVPQAVWRAAGKVRDRAKTNITSAGLVDTGALRNSIVARRMRAGRMGVWYEVGSNLPYSIFQHEGTAAIIRPRRAKVLRFQPAGSSTFVFAKQVRGVKGTPYLTDALRSLTTNDFT